MPWASGPRPTAPFPSSSRPTASTPVLRATPRWPRRSGTPTERPRRDGQRYGEPMSERRTAFRICPLCEATCGLELLVEDDRIVRARGDREHVFSRGFICPKGAAYPQLVHDPDRLRRPMVRENGEWREVGW